MKHTALVALAFLFSSSLYAQTEPTETLIQGEVEQGFVVAPDFKFTDVDGEFSAFAGAYGGWLLNRKLLLGGGFYTLANRSGPESLDYGGAVVEYFVNQGSLVNVSVRGLVGAGRAVLGSPFEDRPFDSSDNTRVNLPGFGRGPLNQFHRRFPDDEFPVRDLTRSSDFFVAEPEVNVMLNVTEQVRFSFGGGYRFIGGASQLNERLDGFSANVSLKLMFF